MAKRAKFPKYGCWCLQQAQGHHPADQGQRQLYRRNYRIKWNNTGRGGKGVISQI